jgi:hypothetical protein
VRRVVDSEFLASDKPEVRALLQPHACECVVPGLSSMARLVLWFCLFVRSFADALTCVCPQKFALACKLAHFRKTGKENQAAIADKERQLAARAAPS